MLADTVYCNRTEKSPAVFAGALKAVAARNGFLVANEQMMTVAETFRAHGAPVADDFDLHMIQLCKPDKAAVSLQGNPERSVLMPKFVMAFSGDGWTQIRFHHYCRETIATLVRDPDFPVSLETSYRAIIKMIEEAAGGSVSAEDAKGALIEVGL